MVNDRLEDVFVLPNKSYFLWILGWSVNVKTKKEINTFYPLRMC